jgi:hypothetical protein
MIKKKWERFFRMEHNPEAMDNVSYLYREATHFTPRKLLHWDDLSLCEKTLIEMIGKRKNMSLGHVMDLSSAGISAAVSQRFRVLSWDRRESAKKNELYDTVLAIQTGPATLDLKDLLKNWWELVKPYGYMIFSLHLTPTQSGDTQTLWNLPDALKLFRNLSPSPSPITGSGQWGQFQGDRAVYTVFSLQKTEDPSCEGEFFLPLELFVSL